MRIVDRATFLALPPGTLFAKYKPCVFDEIAIKGDTIGENDFSYQSLLNVDASDGGDLTSKLFAAELDGDTFAMDLDFESRDGCFDERQLFLIWQADDLRQLIERLQRAAMAALGTKISPAR